MSDIVYTVEKIGKEDLALGQGTFTRQSRTSPGSTTSITKINASHIPVVDAAGLFTATDVDGVLAEIGKSKIHSVYFPGVVCGAVADQYFSIFYNYIGTTVSLDAVNYIGMWGYDEPAANYPIVKVYTVSAAGVIGSTAQATINFNSNASRSAFYRKQLTTSGIAIGNGEGALLHFSGSSNLPPGTFSVKVTG